MRIPRSRLPKRKNSFVLVGSLVVALVLGVILIGVLGSFYSEKIHEGCVVESKDRSRDADGASSYRVYTENCGVFSVEDTIVKGQFDSSDQYNEIKVGQTYDLTTIGWRKPMLSMFENIIEVSKTD